MYSMKEKYRQNTILKSSTSSYSARHHRNDDDHGEWHSRKRTSDSRHDRHRSPEMTKQDKYYEMMKRDKREPRHADDYDSRREKRTGTGKDLDPKYSRDGRGDYHRSRSDNHRDHDVREHKDKPVGVRGREYSMEKKNSVFAHLSQAVRKVRESHHNGKAAQDIDDARRWGHSGYKELYHEDRRGEDSHRRPRKGDSSFHTERSRDFSRSRSPAGKSSTRKMLLPARRQEVFKAEVGNSNKAGRSEKPNSTTGISLKTPVKRSVPTSASGTKIKGKEDMDDDDLAVIRALREEREKLLAASKKPRSTSSLSSDSRTAKHRPKGRAPRKSVSRSRSRSGSRSRSFSSSSRSSDDDDVLELHPQKRRKTKSNHSSSSDDDSRSDSSAISCLASDSGRRSPGSISSSSSFSAGSRHSTSNKGKGDKLAKTTPGSKKVSANITPTSKAAGSESANKTISGSGGKSGNNSTAANEKSKDQTPKTGKGRVGHKKSLSSSKSKGAKQTEGKKDSESDSESSSDSDAEPRMSLSERFAKLTQMHTDKREFAKPVLSVNEIDTKMRVVRDLRNPETRILVDGQQHAQPDGRRRSRPKTPDVVTAEGARRYSSADRRRHFERMDRDEPSERPSDWSDPRVRFTYYRDRGYFDERPLQFEEYIKWEKWWYEYRDWLASEGYYERAAAAAAASAHPERGPAVGGVDVRTPSGWHYEQRPEHRGRPHPPVFDARERLGRPPLLGPGPRSGGRASYFPLDPNAPGNPSNRSIGHGVDGSLVINVRRGQHSAFPGAQYGYRGGRSHRPY